MPETEKGKTIKSAMKKEYGEEEGERVFYASKNKGTISGVDRARFVRTVSDAARAGKPARDALSQGLAVQTAANMARGGDFFTQIRKASSDGMLAKDAIRTALDAGIKGMQRGVRRAPQTGAVPRHPEGPVFSKGGR